jgi:AcrR family transcriptional regulator
LRQPLDTLAGEAVGVRKRLDEDRRGELLDGFMRIIAERGFSQVTIADLARELRCSAATLYKIAPSKDSLVLLAIARWSDGTFAAMEARSAAGRTASERARVYFRTGAERTRPLSLAFYADIGRYESTRMVWWTGVVERYIDRFMELVESAEEAGEIRPINAYLLAEVLRQIGSVTRNDRTLRAAGLTHEQAVLEIDSLIWEGLRKA